MLVAPSAIATASEERTVPPVEQRGRALLPQRGAEAAGEAELVGGLAEQDRAGVADQLGSSCGDLQGTVPPVKRHGEERSSSGD
jgi:hypothetical protein